MGGSFALGYAFAVLSFSAPVHGCARPAAAGAPVLPQMMARAGGGAGALCLPDAYKPTEEGGALNYELSLYNAIRAQMERDDLGVTVDDRDRSRAADSNPRYRIEECIH